MAAAAAAKPTLQSLLCRSLPTLRHILPAETRLAALDITPSHITLALSNPSRTHAAPFGVLSRLNPTTDARLLRPALGPLSVSGLVVGVSPEQPPDTALIEALLANDVLPSLRGVLFYSEAHALSRALRARDDFLNATEILPVLETRKRGRHHDAMNPRVSRQDFQTGFQTRACISATELLQAVLDDLNK